MNIFQRFMNWAFGWQYVLLVDHEMMAKIRRAYFLGGRLYANPYLPDTRTEILPDGGVNGRSYITEWRPITNGVPEYFNKRPENNQ